MNVKPGNIGERISYARGAKGLTQSDLARALGTSPGHVHDKEACKSKPSGPFLVALEYVTGVNAQWVKTGEGDVFVQRNGQEVCIPPPGHDWIQLPEHAPGPLDDEEREQLERTITVLRCPPGCEEEPREAILPNIRIFYRVTKKYVEELKESGQSPSGGKDRKDHNSGGGSRRATAGGNK